MKYTKEVDDCWIIPKERFNNHEYIEERVSEIPERDKALFKGILDYLYNYNGTEKINDNKLHLISQLEPREQIVVNQLRKYTNGKGKQKDANGYKALRQARKMHYKCEKCGFPDVRVLEYDHVTGRRDPNTDIACLCANCHNIKSREEDW